MNNIFELDPRAMSQAYWDLWNADEQARIDEDIEKNRKANATVALGVAPGTAVHAEQISHKFFFGAHIFNFDQLGSHEANERYKAMYGTLFNSATVAFYWRTFEPVEGHMRFEQAEHDTEEWWNGRKNPEWEPHWRRPATDPVIDFCESKGLRIHGHTLVWNNSEWHVPAWLMAKLPHDILAEMLTNDRCGDSILKQPLDTVLKRIPDYVGQVDEAIDRRIRAIAERYGRRVSSWDVCNESALDFKQGNLRDPRICRGYHKRFMPGDYCHLAFRKAMKYFPTEAKLNINDYLIEEAYRSQVKDMLARGDKIDVMGLQMHMFDPNQCRRIAAGEANVTRLGGSPAGIRSSLDCVRVPGMPFHLSEITITSPETDEKGQMIQATIARNLYRLWFSEPQMSGITWWNTVDGCGAPGEPSVSGLCFRDMRPKAAYFALDSLVNHEWHTSLDLAAGADGAVSFRGFRGRYRLTWTRPDGTAAETIASVD